MIGRLVDRTVGGMVLGMGLAWVTGCAWTDAPAEEAVAACARDRAPWGAGVVRRDALGAFTLDDRPFVPRGIGSYPLLEHAGNGRMDAVHDIFDQAIALGRPLVRTNAFFDGGDNPARIRADDGTLRDDGLAGLDRLLAAAAERGVRLILVLANNWHHYGGAPAVVRMAAPGEGLPKDAFWSDPRVVEAQRSYVQHLVRRTNAVNGRAYAEDPAVFAWELANEARCDDEDWCDAGTLVRWARTMADSIREAGATQLVAWGGSGHRDRHGEDLGRIAVEGGVDVLTLHVYPFARHALRLDARSAGQRNALGIRLGVEAIRDRAAVARAHRLPLLVEELGWRNSDRADRDGERAVVIGAWLRAADAEGVGTVPWMIGERGRPDYDQLLIRPEEDRATVRALRCE